MYSLFRISNVVKLNFIERRLLSQMELASLSQEELLKRCQQLLEENQRLKLNVSKEKDNAPANLNTAKKRTLKQRPFDFGKYKTNRIAFKFLYLGWDYQGFASQENTANTIEAEIFAALDKSKLIEDRGTAGYSRCGRTDKGVSAFGQVIALNVRSNFLKDDSEEKNKQKKELPYVTILNRNLPPDIRILAYAYVDDSFDARFSCGTRKYRYFFPIDKLDINAMQRAASKLVGEHDFRNFCKVDIGNNVNHFIRRVTSYTVKSPTSDDNPFNLCEMEITGFAFLWHQVRCMAAVLLLVGLGHEKPEIIDELLNIDKCPRRPQYGLASDATELNIVKLYQIWSAKSIQSQMLYSMINDLHRKLCNPSENPVPLTSTILPSYNQKKYTQLSKRPICAAFDRHMEKLSAKRVKLEEKYHSNDKSVFSRLGNNGRR